MFLPLYMPYKYMKLYWRTKKDIKQGIENAQAGRVIYYFGSPTHANLGDLAQAMCIRKWLKKHFPENHVTEIGLDAIVDTPLSVLPYLKKHLRATDLILFQSGYTTTDWGRGQHDATHRIIIEAFPCNKILMMPQTIFFVSEKNKERTATVYNTAKNMLFLARDKVSYAMALEMFPDVSAMLYPDIVTTLIGAYAPSKSREGILFCCRNDDEKFYSSEEIGMLIKKFAPDWEIAQCDTSKNVDRYDVLESPEKHIWNEIEYYSNFKLIITDRYHGTIFSLIAGTPVIIIKTTDHKVVTGAEWFKNIYEDYAQVANNLEDAYEKGIAMLQKAPNPRMSPYFEKEYYDKLPEIWLSEK
jgi:Exopolysaccharide biosynthesis protein